MIPLVSPDEGRKVEILIIVVRNPTTPFVDDLAEWIRSWASDLETQVRVPWSARQSEW